MLNAFARRLNPILPAIRAAGYGGYYWVLDQAEIATDVMFKTRPQLLRGLARPGPPRRLNMSSEDVLGFLGRKLHPSLQAQVVTDTKRRPEGWRVRHRMGGNWVKVYDKVSVLRVETTINNPREFRIQRRRHQRRGPARAAVVPDAKGRQRPVAQLPGRHRGQPPLPRRPRRRPIERRRRRRPRRLVPATNQPRAQRYARFNPLSPADLALFRAAMAGEHAIRGFRNTDITHRLYRRPPADRDEAHRRCERVSRLIVKLRGHGLVAKIPRARRYRVTRYGHRVMTAAIALHDDQFPTTTSPRLTESRPCLSRRANLAGIGSNAGTVALICAGTSARSGSHHGIRSGRVSIVSVHRRRDNVDPTHQRGDAPILDHRNRCASRSAWTMRIGISPLGGIPPPHPS